MDFVNTLLVTLKEPKGMWQSILEAFKGALGTYILAVILIAVIVRLLFSLVDIVNKKVSMKNADISNKMKPELDAVKAKYGNDPATMQKKTSEIYKKYQFNMLGSCLPMLVALVLQFTVFLTLWNALQSVSNFNIVEKYQDLKNVYANVININNDADEINFSEGDRLKIELEEADGEKTLVLSVMKQESEVAEFTKSYVFDESLASDNEAVWRLIKKFVEKPAELAPVEPTAKINEDAESPKKSEDYSPTKLSAALKAAAETLVQERYISTQEGFLWIKNIYKSESPSSPLFTESEIKKYISGFYSEDEKAAEKEYDFEGTIFKNVTAGIDHEKLGVNGYYILTIIAVLTSVLSMWLSNFLMRKKGEPKQKQSLAMYFIMPLIIGLFTFMYTSLFAIYLIVGQLMMLLLTPLTTFVVKKWTDLDAKKKKQKTEVVVDYRRKDL